MGVLTDFVVMDRLDAQRVCESDCPCRDFAGMDAKGIDTVKLGTLYAVLTGKEFDPLFMMGGSLCSGGEEGPWVFEVPTDLVRRLVDLTAKQLQSVAAKWAATEEFSPKYDHWPAEAVRQILEELAALCTRAVSEKKEVLMWMCL
jgi:hypothetical protein